MIGRCPLTNLIRTALINPLERSPELMRAELAGKFPQYRAQALVDSEIGWRLYTKGAVYSLSFVEVVPPASKLINNEVARQLLLAAVNS